ncbi:MAG: prenyltransferase/squalene oxidase repeat-containing protein, partial [Planctomycetota bacterium]
MQDHDFIPPSLPDDPEPELAGIVSDSSLATMQPLAAPRTPTPDAVDDGTPHETVTQGPPPRRQWWKAPLLLIWDYFLDTSPPWLVSVAAHITVFLILALLITGVPRLRTVDLTATFSTERGEQLEEPVLELDSTAEEPTTDHQMMPLELPPVEMPLTSAPMLPSSLSGVNASSNFDAPVTAVSLSGRDPGMKQALLKAYGGTATTEQAVAMALDWLSRRQQARGSWSFKEGYRDPSIYEVDNKEAATGMALLAFQGAGHTHVRGDYREVVQSGWYWLLNQQEENGNFFRRGEENQPLYTQAICSIALCELYALSRDEKLREPAQRATDYLIKAQDELGGWRYEVGYDSDTSVTGWVVMALKSAQMAGLIVPSRVFDRVHKYLDMAAVDDGAHYGYKPGHAATPAMTAEALLCRQYLGWKRDDPRLVQGVETLLRNQIIWREPNTYYWYYATQVTHHMEGDTWREWNKSMRERIPKKQQQTGPERGSWPPPERDRWSVLSGRLYTTCLCTYM